MFAEVKTLLFRPISPKIGCFILVLLLMWQVVSGVRGFILLDKAVALGHDPLMAEKIKADQVFLTAGYKAPLFGDYVPKTLNDSGIKQSMLNLTVVGIMYAKDEAESHVIIRSASGREKTYHVGDSLPGGAIIKRITTDGVLIRQRGSLESLRFPKNALRFDLPAKPLERSE